MPLGALALVLISAVLHASWNLIAKHNRGSSLFFFQALVAATVIFLVPFIVLLIQNPFPPEGWIWIILTGIIHTFYFGTLATAYRRADLSVAYPIARGLGPALVLVVAVGILREPVSALGVTGVVAVVLGIYTINLQRNQPGSWLAPIQTLTRPEGRYAAATGVSIAAYTLIDNQGVSVVHPLVYIYFMYALSGLGVLVIFAVRPPDWSALRQPRPWVQAAALAVLSIAAYSLVLTALTMAPTPYVSAARELSIVIGAVLGVLFLGEPLRRERIGGAVSVAAGVAMIAAA